jgi:hypothetical protein
MELGCTVIAFAVTASSRVECARPKARWVNRQGLLVFSLFKKTQHEKASACSPDFASSQPRKPHSPPTSPGVHNPQLSNDIQLSNGHLQWQGNWCSHVKPVHILPLLYLALHLPSTALEDLSSIPDAYSVDHSLAVATNWRSRAQPYRSWEQTKERQKQAAADFFPVFGSPSERV